MARPIVALLTDFGTRDVYAGELRGAVLTACPEATLVDVTHHVAPHDVEAGAWALARAFQAFPAGTVFLVVVDPGVGTSRRGLAAEAGHHRFVAPDNGVLSHALDQAGPARVHELGRPALFRTDVSATFHGRDVFAPVAGRLAGGLALGEVGPLASDLVRLAVPPLREAGPGAWELTVVDVDGFGNATTNLTAGSLYELSASGRVELRIGAARLPVVRTYGELAEGAAGALIGSSGRLEIALNRGRAAERFGLTRGASVRLVVEDVQAGRGGPETPR